jgi:ubiquinol-cytochrome c reductase cytochrome c1 subunit
MKKLIALLLATLGFVGSAQAASGGIEWDKFPKEKMADMAALQNGAKLFVNYCLNCHSAAFMRYNRMRDIGLTEADIKNNLLFAADKVGETMKVSLDAKDAKAFFGANPPDLTVIARVPMAPRVRVRTISTPTCGTSTATTPRRPAGTTWPSPASRCRT